MKNLIILIILSTISFSFQGQKIKEIDLSSNSEMNYIFSRIITKSAYTKSLYNDGLFISIYELSDSKATPSDYMEDFLSSYIISVFPDGDYYSSSKLYKIEGLINPKIIEIKEHKYPQFSIKIEHGFFNKRKVKIFVLEGVK